MSAFSDGVNKVWVLRTHAPREGMDFEGFSSLEDAALQLLFMDSWKPGWEERIQKFRAALDRRYADAIHEHDWVDAVEGPEVVGKVCSTCGAVQEMSDDD